MLRCEGVSKYFGSLAAVKNVSFEVPEGQLCGVAGPNGAGKTTLFNAITGYLRPEEGKIWFGKVLLNKLRPHEICHLGIVRTFQTPHVISTGSVLENVMTAAYHRIHRRGFGLRGYPKDLKKESIRILDEIELSAKMDDIAETLSLYDMKRLMLATALVMKPKILLLDEAVAGLNPKEVEETKKLVKKINKSGVTILIIEHNMGFLLKTSERVIILDSGQKICDGSPDYVAKDEEVIRAYLGEKGTS